MYGLSVFLNISGFSPTSRPFWPLGLKIHADSIALDRTGSTLYFGALTGAKLYAISTSHLLFAVDKMAQIRADEQHGVAVDVKGRKDLEMKVIEALHEVSSEKPVTDGLSSDANGYLWATAVEQWALALLVPENLVPGWHEGVNSNRKRVVKVVQSQSLLRWPDGLSFGPDGLYVTCSALHYSLLLKTTNISAHGPFHILRLSTKNLKKVFDLVRTKTSQYFTLPAAGH